MSFSIVCDAQTNKQLLKSYEDTLIGHAYNIVKGKDATTRQIAIHHFRKVLYRALKVENSFTYSFDSLIYISILTSEDKKFRIFNWNLLKNNGTYRHFGIIQLKTENGVKLIELQDCSDNIFQPQDTILRECWFGAHYYKVITKKYKKKTHYILLGLDANNNITNKKLIEVLTFENDKPIFGADVFDLKNDTTVYRMVFEYKNEVYMSARYYEKEKRIVFDHLSPDKEENKDFYMFYGPDMTYDALRYKKGKWHLVKNVEMRN